MMEDPSVLGILRNTTSIKRAEFLQRLQHLTPGRMCLMLKYLMQNEEDSVQVLSEYFGVALAFTALGALIRKTNDTNYRSKDAKKFERMAFESMLRAAMKRLRDLALHAHGLDEKIREMRIAHEALLQDKETLQAERLKLSEKVKETEAEIIEMRNTRLEDTKANERVVAIFASKQQAWSNEKKRLTQEVESLKKDADMLRGRMKVLRREQEQNCKGCEEKGRIIDDLSGNLVEREFLMMASMEEAKVDQNERNELSVKLAIADMIAGDLREKLATEIQQHKLDHQKYEATIAEMMAEKQATEHQAERIRKELESLQKVVTTRPEEKNHGDSLVKFSEELAKLKQEVQDKQKMIAAMLRKDFAVVEERNRLARDLTILKMKVKSLEKERERWKQIAEGRECTIEQGKPLTVPQSSGKTLDSNMMKIAEVERLHADEVKNMQSMYKKQIDALQMQVNHYQERIAELEENIFLHFTEGEQRFFIQDKETCDKSDNLGSRHGSGSLGRKDSMEAEIEAKELQVSSTKQLLVQYLDKGRKNEQEVDKWKRLYFAAKRTIETLESELADNGALPQIVMSEQGNRYVTKSEQRHFQEIDAFERQMRAKDERMEAFRQHLMAMELESQRRHAEIEFLKNRLMQAHAETLEAKRLQRQSDRALTTPMPRLLAQEPYCYDSENALTITNDQSHVKEIVVDVMETDPQIVEGMQTIKGVSDLEFDRSYDKGVAESPMGKNELVKTNIAKLSSFHDEFFFGFQGPSLISKYSAGDFLENLSTGDTKIEIKNAIDTACLEVERLSEIITEAKEQMLQVDSWAGDHFRQLVGQVAQVSRAVQDLRKLKSLLSATGEMQNEHMLQCCKTGHNSEQEGKEAERRCEVHVPKRESKVDTSFSVRSLPLSSKGSWEKKVAPIYDWKGQMKAGGRMSSSSTVSLLDLMARDDGSVSKQSREITSFVGEVTDKIDSDKSAQNLPLSSGAQTTVEASNRLKLLKHQIFG